MYRPTDRFLEYLHPYNRLCFSWPYASILIDSTPPKQNPDMLMKLPE